MVKKKLCLIIIIFLVISSFINVSSGKYNPIKKESKKSSISLFDFKFGIVNGRVFIYQTPDSFPPDEGYPVLFLFHGATQRSFSWFFKTNPWSMLQTELKDKAVERGFLVIAASSLRPYFIGPRAWDVFDKTQNNIDLVLVNNLISWLNISDLEVDLNNLFCAGFSSGAFMTSYLGIYQGASFNAICAHSGAYADSINIDLQPLFDTDSAIDIPETHPPTVLVHGEKDSIVPVNCSYHYYSEMVDQGFDCELLINPEGEHIWQDMFSDDILDFFESHLE